MCDADYSLANLRLDALKLATHLGAGQGIERAERLVHQQNRRVDGQRARKSDALALPAGQFTRVTVGVSLRVEADQIEQFIDARADAVFGPALQSRYDRHVAPDGHMREQPDFLQHVAYPAAELDRIPIG